MKKFSLFLSLLSSILVCSCGDDTSDVTESLSQDSQLVSLFNFESLTILEKEKHSIIYVGDKNVIKCEWSPKGDFEPEIKFSCDNPNVLKIGITGLYEALAVGTTNVFVTCVYDGDIIVDSMKITVKEG